MKHFYYKQLFIFNTILIFLFLFNLNFVYALNLRPESFPDHNAGYTTDSEGIQGFIFTDDYNSTEIQNNQYNNKLLEEELDKKDCYKWGGKCKSQKEEYEIENKALLCLSGGSCFVEACKYKGGTCQVGSCKTDQRQIWGIQCPDSNNICCEDFKPKGLTFTPEVGIPGFTKPQPVNGGLMGTFGNKLYSYLLGLSGIVAVIILILAGFQWVTAGGNQNKIGQAKERIRNVIIGLILLACSHLILYTVNPELVKIKVLEVNDLTPQ
ncbi:MAG: pilin [Patescibacteria group bacterium]|nr:pilin [Patescibacteria group bacterium]